MSFMFNNRVRKSEKGSENLESEKAGRTCKTPLENVRGLKQGSPCREQRGAGVNHHTETEN